MPGALRTPALSRRRVVASGALCASLGLDMSGAVNVFLRAAIKAKAIPFVIADEPDEGYRTYIRETIAKRMENVDDPNREIIPAERVWAQLEKKWGSK